MAPNGQIELFDDGTCRLDVVRIIACVVESDIVAIRKLLNIDDSIFGGC